MIFSSTKFGKLFPGQYIWLWSTSNVVNQQCDQISQKFATLVSILKSLVIFGVFLSYSAKFVNLLWPFLLLGQMFIVVNGQILNN